MRPELVGIVQTTLWSLIGQACTLRTPGGQIVNTRCVFGTDEDATTPEHGELQVRNVVDELWFRRSEFPNGIERGTVINVSGTMYRVDEVTKRDPNSIVVAVLNA